jgi:PAS domain-containing protein
VSLFRDFRNRDLIEIQQRERGLRIALEATTDRLRDFARSASDSFWESDRGGQVTFAAGPAAAISGLRSGVALNDVLLPAASIRQRALNLKKRARAAAAAPSIVVSAER